MMDVSPDSEKPVVKMAGQIRGILGSFFKKILIELGVDGTKLEQLVTRHINNPEGGLMHESASKRSSERRNLLDALMSDHMTFLSFVKGLHVLCVVGYKMELFTIDNNGNENYHTHKPQMNQDSELTRYVLSEFFNIILTQLGITPEVLETMVIKHINNPEGGLMHESASKRSSERRNLLDALTGDKMTFLSFVKGLHVLCIVRFKIQLTLEHRNGISTIHSITVALNSKGKHDE